MSEKEKGPEETKLINRLVDMGAQNFHVSWGPEAKNATSEELAKDLNNAFDAIERGDYEEMVFGDE